MEDEKDIPGSVHLPKSNPGKPLHSTENQVMNNSEKKDELTWSDSCVPFYEELHAAPAASNSLKEMAAGYSASLNAIAQHAWQLDEECQNAKPTLDAPFICGYESGVVNPEDLVNGVLIQVPRCSKLWAGDQLRMRWGCNTFYSDIPVSASREGGRLAQFINTERLAKYENGEIAIRYEVIRRSRLVGVSHPLTITVRGSKIRPKQASPVRAIRRRALNV